MKKTKNRILQQIMIIVVILILINSPINANAFTDISPNEWFYENIVSLNSRGIIDGYTDNTFKPLNNVSHGESIKLLVALKGVELPNESDNLPIRRLNIVKNENHWAERYMQAAIDNQMLHLNDLGLDYSEQATRTDVATYIINYVNTTKDLEPISTEIKIGEDLNSNFSDAYGEGLDFLFASRIIKGVPVNDGKNQFRGEKAVTRAEFSAMIDRAERFILGEDLEEIEDEIEEEIPKDKYAIINEKRRIENNSIDKYLKNTKKIEDLIMAIYHMKYNNLESIILTYSPDHLDGMIYDSQLSKEYVDDVRAAYNYVSSSYPEFFFGENRITIATNNDGKGGIIITLSIKSPIHTREESVRRRDVFDRETIVEAKKMIDNGLVNENMSQLELAQVLHKWTIERIKYDHSKDVKTYDGYSALVEGKTVCVGYSSLLHRMFTIFGIDVVGVTGTAMDDLHIWGEAMIDGQKYYIDPTWNDELNTMRYFTTDIDTFVNKNERTWDKDFFNSFRYLIK